MTSLSGDDIQYLATLSSVQLTEEDVDMLKKDLPSIIQYVDLLQEIDTDKVDPTYQVTGLSNIWREDEIESSLSGEVLVSLAVSSRENAIQVPRVL